MELLEWKRREAPYVCDMSLWYLFVARSERADEWGGRVDALPETKRWHFCDSQALGFDHMHGHKRAATGDEASVHFQGDAKGDISGFIAARS